MVRWMSGWKRRHLIVPTSRKEIYRIKYESMNKLSQLKTCCRPWNQTRLNLVIPDQPKLCCLSACKLQSGNVKIPSAQAWMCLAISSTITMPPKVPAFWGSYSPVQGSLCQRCWHQLVTRTFWSRAKDQGGMVKSWQLTRANDITFEWGSRRYHK